VRKKFVTTSIALQMPVKELFALMDKDSTEGQTHKNWCKIFDIDGINYGGKLRSIRLQCIKRSPVCCECGLVATDASLETNKTNLPNGYHFNVYSANGILFTMDHIFPASLGGPSALGNLQTMCSTCNGKKKNDLDFGRIFTIPEKEIKTICSNINRQPQTIPTLLGLLLSPSFKENREAVRALGRVSISTNTEKEKLCGLIEMIFDQCYIHPIPRWKKMLLPLKSFKFDIFYLMAIRFCWTIPIFL